MVKPPIVVELCAGTACHLMGAMELMEAVQGMCEAKQGLICMQLIHCLGACGQGPNARIDGRIHSQLTGEQLKRLLTEHLAELDDHE